jgi:hypothetical protein
LANNSNLSTGELEEPKDSVMIAYDDLRVVNFKLIELDYEKQINANLRQVVSNDSIIINNHLAINEQILKDCKKVTRQRNVCFGVGVVGIIATILLLLK